MTQLIADYSDERQAFQELFGVTCAERILLLRGESGCGKTHLLTYCQQIVPDTVTQAPIQLRGTTVTVAEIFYRTGGAVGWDRFNHFARHVAEMQRSPAVKIDRNWLVGMNNHIDVALTAEDQAGREHRRAALTDAWFADARQLPQPLLVLFDTFEQASDEVKAWLSGPFLARVVRTPTVRVVIAGQEIPPAHNIEWGHCCQERALYGVREAEHWMPVVQAMGRYIPNDAPLDWLAGVCHALEGRPEAILKILQRLPRRSALA